MIRGLFVSIVLAAVLLSPAAAAVRPDAMVLRQADVPHGFWREDNASGWLPLPETVRGGPYGYLTLFHAVFRDVSPPYWRTITSTVLVFRRVDGASRFLERETRRLMDVSARARRVTIGAGGWVSTAPDPSPSSTVVAWREGRVLGLVVCERLRRCQATALALARTQQRRMTAAIR